MAAQQALVAATQRTYDLTEARYRAGIDYQPRDVGQGSRRRMESGALANGSQKDGHLGKNHGT
jgi:hypothetical protein